MTGPRFQADVPLQMFVYPVRSDTPLPDEFQKFAPVPAEPATLPPDQIGKQREQWIQQWTRIVQR
jgi:thiamine transport system substrate-binding protein